MKKIVITIFLVIALLISIYNISYASSIDSIFTGADSFLEAGKSTKGEGGFSWEGITNASDLIYNTLLIIGIIAVVIVGAVLGIKFMTSAVEEQAKIKESLIPFVAGAVIIFGAFGIWKLATNIIEGASQSQIPTVTNFDNDYKAGYDDGSFYVRSGNYDIDSMIKNIEEKINKGTATEYDKGLYKALTTL